MYPPDRAGFHDGGVGELDALLFKRSVVMLVWSVPETTVHCEVPSNHNTDTLTVHAYVQFLLVSVWRGVKTWESLKNQAQKSIFVQFVCAHDD